MCVLGLMLILDKNNDVFILYSDNYNRLDVVKSLMRVIINNSVSKEEAQAKIKQFLS